jgi:uncharacterized protein
MKTPLEIVEDVRKALADRNYNAFVDCFAPDAVFETPFALKNTLPKSEGIEAIRARFENNNQLQMINKLYQLHQVNTVVHQSVELSLVTVEYSIEGINNATGASFTIASSIAVIRFKDGKIVNYRDYPNTIGLAAATGLLPQLAASLAK